MASFLGYWQLEFCPKVVVASGEVVSCGTAAEMSSLYSGVQHGALIPLWRTTVS